MLKVVEDNLEELFGYAIKARMVLKALHRKMLHRHLHVAPVDRSPLALVLQLIPKYSQTAINRTFLIGS